MGGRRRKCEPGERWQAFNDFASSVTCARTPYDHNAEMLIRIWKSPCAFRPAGVAASAATGGR